MDNLKTIFAGLSLRNPVIISSSGLTNTAAKNKQLEEAGAGAIVLKSLFEEQIMLQAQHLSSVSMQSPEGDDYLNTYVRAHQLGEYIDLIRETKKVCSIPVIASINCHTNAEWTEYTRNIAAAGADALELNILSMQTEPEYVYGTFEQRHIEILQNVRKHTSLPVIVKLGANLTNPVALIDQLQANGAAAVVLFNRPYQPDIDIHAMSYCSGEIFSSPADLPHVIRWIGIASAQASQLGYAASGGVHNGEGAVKAILAGASAIEICSTVYRNGNSVIREITGFISDWMKQKGYQDIDSFKGIMNARNIGGVNQFERAQFLKYFHEK